MFKRSLIVLFIAGMLCDCSNHHNEEESDIQLQVTSPLRIDTSVTANYVCQIKAIQHIELRTMERGYLQEIFVDEGQHVKQGQLMFRIMPVLLNAELQKAQAEASFAEIELRNAQNLADSNIVSSNELALAKAIYNKAQAELRLAETHLSFTEIRAPFDGMMDHFHVRLGSLVEEGHLLTTLSDISKLWVYYNVPEVEYLNYKKFSKKDSLVKVRLVMANGELFNQPGVVETIEADFDNETGNIAFRATFPNPDRLLRHGETGNIQMLMPFKNALVIPQKATFEILEKKFVYVIGSDSVAHQREIDIEASLPDLFVVKSGLRENERILLEGLRKVRDGNKISFEYKDARHVIAHLKVYSE